MRQLKLIAAGLLSACFAAADEPASVAGSPAQPAAAPAATVLVNYGGSGRRFYVLRPGECTGSYREMIRSRRLDARLVEHSAGLHEIVIDWASKSNNARAAFGLRSRIAGCSLPSGEMLYDFALLDRLARNELAVPLPDGADRRSLQNLLRALAMMYNGRMPKEQQENFARLVSACMTEYNMLASGEGKPQFAIDTDTLQIVHAGRPIGPAPPVAGRGLLSVQATGESMLRRVTEGGRPGQSLQELQRTWDNNSCLRLWEP